MEAQDRCDGCGALTEPDELTPHNGSNLCLTCYGFIIEGSGPQYSLSDESIPGLSCSHFAERNDTANQMYRECYQLHHKVYMDARQAKKDKDFGKARCLFVAAAKLQDLQLKIANLL